MKIVISTFLGILFFIWVLCMPSLAEEEHVCYSNKYACPVTPNLFPKQEGSTNALRFIFPENAQGIPSAETGETMKRAARRISISLLSSEGKDVAIRFTWIGALFVRSYLDWGTYSGTFIVKADGNPNCFFLGTPAGLPANEPCREFLLKIPPGVEVKGIAFSSLGGEYVSKNCPMPELEKEINSALKDSGENFQDETKTARFLTLLEKAIPKYECLPKEGGTPVPAWWLADRQSISNWIQFLNERVGEENDLALRVFAEFYPTAGGFWGEIMVDEIWIALHDHPMFILRNWESIREFKKSILGSLYDNPPGSDIELINIYQGIAEKDPIDKTACEEIIATIRDLIKQIGKG